MDTKGRVTAEGSEKGGRGAPRSAEAAIPGPFPSRFKPPPTCFRAENKVAKEIKAVDEYLDVAIWNGLMQEHQEDYLIHDFLMAEPNTTPTYRGYAYAHIYNTYYSIFDLQRRKDFSHIE